MATTAHQDRITWSSLIRHAIPNDQVVVDLVVDLVMMVVVVMVVVAKEPDTVTLSSLPTSCLYRVCDADVDVASDHLLEYRCCSNLIPLPWREVINHTHGQAMALGARAWLALEQQRHVDSNCSIHSVSHSFIHSVSHSSSSSSCCCDCLTITKRERQLK